MITCQLSHLAARCRERGYTLEEVRACIVSEDGDSITVDETHGSYPRARPTLASPRPQAKPIDAPSFLAKAKNFATSTVKHVAAGMPRASDEEIERRFAVCQGCEFLRDNACMKCGCPVVRESKFISKLAWADSSCPVGKWGPATG